MAATKNQKGGNAGKVDFAKACQDAEKAWETTKKKEIASRGGGGFKDKPIEKGTYRAKLLKASVGVGDKAPWFRLEVSIDDDGATWHGNKYSIFHTVNNDKPFPDRENTNLEDLCLTLRNLGIDTAAMKGKIGVMLPQICEKLNSDTPDVEVYCSPKKDTEPEDDAYRVYVSINKLAD